jgi:hypothetical protein
MMTRHIGLSCPLESIREYLVGAFAASAIAYTPVVEFIHALSGRTHSN